MLLVSLEAPRAGGRGVCVHREWGVGMKFQVCKMKTVLEMDGGYGCLAT